jgi:hypothetical protein
MKLNTEHRRILLELCAMIDAIHEPIRDYTAPRPGVVWELRRRFEGGGVRWASEELSSAARKSAQRALEWLAGAGLVEVLRQAGRAAAVRLTDHGEAIARRLGGDFTSSDHALERLRQLADLIGKPGAGVDGWIPEPLLCGVRWGDPDSTADLSELQTDLLPALVRRWVDWRSSVHGHVWYRLTKAGEAVVEDRVAVERFDDLPEAPADGTDDYIGALIAARSRIGELTPARPGELGFMPCPVSVPVVES